MIANGIEWDSFRAAPSEEQGQKWDEGKQDYYLLPLALIKPLAEVMIAGEKKGYGNFSCMKPFENSNRRFYNGTFRHLEQCQLNPLAIDEETGCYHAAQVAFNSLMRLYHALEENKRNAKIKHVDKEIKP